MRLVNIKYQDSYIYIDLKISQEFRKVIPKVRSIYVEYKIKVFDQITREIYLVKKKDVIRLQHRLIIIIKLKKIIYPKESEIFIDQFKISFQDDSKRVFKIGKSYVFTDIETSEEIHFENQVKKMKKQDIKKESQEFKLKKEVIKQVPISASGLKKLEVESAPKNTMKEIEQKIDEQLENKLEQLELDIKQVCYNLFDLLIANLPLPQNKEELEYNGTLINSIRRYIQEELSQSVSGEI